MYSFEYTIKMVLFIHEDLPFSNWIAQLRFIHNRRTEGEASRRTLHKGSDVDCWLKSFCNKKRVIFCSHSQIRLNYADSLGSAVIFLLIIWSQSTLHCDIKLSIPQYVIRKITFNQYIRGSAYIEPVTRSNGKWLVGSLNCFSSNSFKKCSCKHKSRTIIFNWCVFFFLSLLQ